MTGVRRGFTLLEVLMAGFIAVAILSIAHEWVAFSLRVMERDARAAAAQADREALRAILREDLGRASRLVPDRTGKGFALECPSEASISGATGPDFVVYDCEDRQGGPVLVRTLFPAAGGPPSVRRLASGATGCQGASRGALWRVEVTWPPPGPGKVDSVVVETGTRIRTRE